MAVRFLTPLLRTSATASLTLLTVASLPLAPIHAASLVRVANTAPITVSGSVNPNTNAYYGEENVTFSNAQIITALTIKITFNGDTSTSVVATNLRSYDAVGNLNRTITGAGQHYAFQNAAFTLPAGQTVIPGTGRIAAAQFDFLNGDGVHYNCASDSYSMYGTLADGTSFTFNGHFDGAVGSGATLTATPTAIVTPSVTPTGTTSPTATPMTTTTPVPQNTAVTVSSRAQTGNPSNGEENILITNTLPITKLTIQFIISANPFPSNFRGYDEFGNLTRTFVHTGNHHDIEYVTFTLAPGQTITPGMMRTVGTQFDFIYGTGAQYQYSVDTYSVMGTTADNVPFSTSGHF